MAQSIEIAEMIMDQAADNRNGLIKNKSKINHSTLM